MPKKATSSSRITAIKEGESALGYYVYSDGTSNWGTGLWRNGEFPVLATKEIHQKTIAEKIEWLAEEAKTKETA